MAFFDFTDRTPMWGNVGSELQKMDPRTGTGWAPDYSSLGFWGGGQPMMSAFDKQMKDIADAREARMKQDIAQMSSGSQFDQSVMDAMAKLAQMRSSSNEKSLDRDVDREKMQSAEKLGLSKEQRDLMKWMVGEQKADTRSKDQSNARIRSAEIAQEGKFSRPPADMNWEKMAKKELVAAGNKKPDPAAINQRALELYNSWRQKPGASNEDLSGAFRKQEAGDRVEMQVKGMSVSPEEMAAYDGGAPQGSARYGGNYGESGAAPALKSAYSGQSPMYQNREIQENIAAGFQKPFQTAGDMQQETEHPPLVKTGRPLDNMAER